MTLGQKKLARWLRGMGEFKIRGGELKNLGFRIYVLSTTVLFVAAVNAQQGNSGAPGASAAGSDEGLAEIIVTAQRRTEDVLHVPVSMTVASGDSIKEAGIYNLASLPSLAPSLQTSNDDAYSIRGVGTTTFSPTIEPTVSEVVDDVVLGNPTFASAPFYDLQRVEVLNGPQGLLFGKNASAGLINITTTMPKLNEFSGSISAEGVSRYRPGPDGPGENLQGAVNIPIGDRSALRIAGIYNGQDSLIQYVGPTPSGRFDPNLSQYGGRIKFLTTPMDGLSIYLIGDYMKSRGSASFTDETLRSLGPGSPTAPVAAAEGITPSTTNLQVATDAGTHRDVSMGGASAKIGYTFGGGFELTSITAWKKLNTDFSADSDQTALNGLDLNKNVTGYSQVTQELRIALPNEGRLTGQGGLYYYYSQTHNTVNREGMNNVPDFVAVNFPFCVGATVQPGPPPNCSVDNLSFLGQDSVLTQHNHSYAGFAQFGYKLTDSLMFSAGARLTHDTADINLLENTQPYFVTLGVPNNLTVESVSGNNVSYKVGPEWQVTPDIMVYGFYGRGYKGPGFSNTAPARGANISVSPEISNGGEIGIKGAAWDRRVTYSVAAFYTKFNDLQVQAWDAALQTTVLQNAATATTKGVDVSVQARPISELTLSASVSMLHAVYDSYPNAQCYPTQATVTPSCATGPTFDNAGQPILLSAKFSGSLSGEYTHPVSANLNGVLGLGVYRRSPFTSGFSPGELVAETTRFDGNLGLRSGTWSAAIFCKNCFNKIQPYGIGQYPGDEQPPHPVLSYTQRWGDDSVRTVGGRFSYNF